MSYILGQYNKASDGDDSAFMTLLTGGTPKRKAGNSDSGVTGDSGFDPFENECITMANTMTTSKNYYFHGKIKRLSSEQLFYIKLINYDDATQDYKEQYIKTITVQGGSTSEWVDIEFIFNPLISFNTILFELKRETEDYRTETRYPVIIYEELSVINNIITEKIATDVQLVKLGIQSRPSLAMCINGEEIHTNKSGIYEVKNGIIFVSFFSVVSPAAEAALDLKALESELAALADNYSEEDKKNNIMSKCIFDTEKTRVIDAFTLDYMYEEA